jgi:hypothetical protein
MGNVKDIAERHYLHAIAVSIEVGMPDESKSRCVLGVHGVFSAAEQTVVPGCDLSDEPLEIVPGFR